MKDTRVTRRRPSGGAAIVALLCCAGMAFGQAVDSRVAAGSNHAAAHALRNGAGVTIGVIEVASSTGQTGIIAGNLGARLGVQWDYRTLGPGSPAPPAAPGNNDHSTLVSSCAAANNTANLIGVANGASVVFGAIDTDNSLRYATSHLRTTQGANLFNMSWGAPGNTPTGQAADSIYLDWFQNRYDALCIKSAGNRGDPTSPPVPGNPASANSQITAPGDFYNGITVGASDRNFTARARYSSYWMSGDTGNQPDGRGKPDILAPGTDMDDNLAYAPVNRPTSGTSFAAPHVAGTAALLVQNGLALGGGPPAGANRPPTAHLAIKSLILNSARKRGITGQNSGAAVAVSRDYSGAGRTDQQTSDEDYLNGPNTLRVGVTPANGAAPNATADWTPTQWFKNAGPFDPFIAQRPLDDEQGTGVLDAHRALINMNGGEQQPSVISGIGWDRDTVGILGGPVTKSYDFNIHIPANSFITATLCWDRLITETNAVGGLLDRVDLNDTYGPTGGALINGLADLDLRFRYHGAMGNFLLAASVSSIDNVEHLHIPTSFAISPGELSIEVNLFNANGLGAIDYGLAWWTVPTPGTVALLALAGLGAFRRRRHGAI